MLWDNPENYFTKEIQFIYFDYFEKINLFIKDQLIHKNVTSMTSM